MSQRGSLRKRGETWTAYWFVPGPDGRRRQRSKGGFRTKRDAQAHLTEVLGDVQAGTYSEPKKITVATYLREEWLPTLTQRSSTRASYKTTCESWIIPSIGGVLLPHLTPAHIQRMIDALRAAGGRKGQPLSARSVQYAVVVLRAALGDAVRRGFLSRNPAAAVSRPRAARTEMHFWSAEEAAAFLDHVAEDRLYAAWALFLHRGFRRGEVAGLRWGDVDLEAGRVAITHTRIVVDARDEISEPKTSRGRRSVPLDAELVAALRTHRRHQLEERLAWGEAWVDSGYVFTREDGSPVHPEYFSTTFEARVRRAGLPLIRLHDTRHTAATLALQAGIPTEVVSRWLGHASVSITQDTYQHLIPSMLEEAGEKLSAIISGHRKS